MARYVIMATQSMRSLKRHPPGELYHPVSLAILPAAATFLIIKKERNCDLKV
jgi:hypothetical protein